MYQIVKKEHLNPTVGKMAVEAPLIAKKAEPGQFIIFRAKEDSERIPLTIADYDREKGTVSGSRRSNRAERSRKRIRWSS